MSDDTADGQPAAETREPAPRSAMLQEAIANGGIIPPTTPGWPQLMPDLLPEGPSLADELITMRREEDIRRSGPYPPDDDE
jgi:hypothetical protein